LEALEETDRNPPPQSIEDFRQKLGFSGSE
jgi:hypothetical protein